MIAFGVSAIQVYVLLAIKTYVTSPHVWQIRQTYDEYERVMYHGHVEDTGYNFSIGIGGVDGKYFDPKQFDKLADSTKKLVCLVPFSQLSYLSIILFIWSLSVVGEIRAFANMAEWLYRVDTVDLEDALAQEVEAPEATVVVRGVPKWLKCFVFCFALLPRLLIAIILLWLGSRWLCSTLDFTELLVSSIALEFVIHLNTLLYIHLMTDRSKRDVEHMRLDMQFAHGTPPTANQILLPACAWVTFCLVWIYLYLRHFQMVLPHYNWDVRGPCAPWVAERYSF